MSGLCLLLVVSTSGCSWTNLRLRRSVVNQAGTLTELQYQQVLGNLAMMSLDPDALPTHVNLRDGSAQIQDNGSISSASPSTSFPSVLGSRTVVEQWSVIPVTDDVELRILRVAYRRALGFDDRPDFDLANDVAHDLCKQISNSDYTDLRSDPAVNLAVLDGARLFDGLSMPDPREGQVMDYLKKDRKNYYAESAEIFGLPSLTRLNVIANAFRQWTINSNDEDIVFEDEIKPETIERMDIGDVRGQCQWQGLSPEPPPPSSARPVDRVKQLYHRHGRDPRGLVPGWVRGRQSLANACYVGHYRGQYAWVCPAGRKNLADFSLKILSFATLVKDPSITSVPGGPRYSPSAPVR